MKREDIKEVETKEDLAKLAAGDVISVGNNCYLVTKGPRRHSSAGNKLYITVKRFFPPERDGLDGQAIGSEMDLVEDKIHLWK